MSENEEQLKKPRRKRREFTPESKVGAVKRVLEEGKSTTQVAQDLDLTESALRILGTAGQGGPGTGQGRSVDVRIPDQLDHRFRKSITDSGGVHHPGRA